MIPRGGAGGDHLVLRTPRVTRTLDLSVRDDTVSVVATPQEVTRLVVDWLDAFIAEALEGDAPHVTGR